MQTPEERAATKRAAYLRRRNADPEAWRQREREKMRQWRENPDNQAKGREAVKRWREENKDYDAAYKRAYWHIPANVRRLQDQYTRKKYEITRREYEQVYLMLWYRQRGCCAVCGTPPGKESSGRNGYSGALHLDHDHATGRLRGLMCGHCNRALGMLEESPARIQALLAYVQLYSQ